MMKNIKLSREDANIIYISLVENIVHYTELIVDNTNKKIDEPFMQRAIIQAIMGVKSRVSTLYLTEFKNKFTCEDTLNNMLLLIHQRYSNSKKQTALGELHMPTIHESLVEAYNGIIKCKNLDPTKALSSHENYQQVMKELTSALHTYSSKAEEFPASWKDIELELQNKILQEYPVIDEINKIAEESINIAGTAENNLAETIKKIRESAPFDLSENIKELAETATNKAIEAAKTAKDFTYSYTGDIGEHAKELAQTATTKAMELGGKAKDFTESYTGNIGEHAKEFAQTATTKAMEAAKAAKSFTESYTGDISELIKKIDNKAIITLIVMLVVSIFTCVHFGKKYFNNHNDEHAY